MAGAWQQSQERAPTKEMTRQHTDCSSMYSTKFIKNCFMYYCIKHTGALHTGFNQHNEPVNKLPKIGWASGILPTKLVLTQDQWVLRTMAGYHLELTEAPTQVRPPHQLKCLPESRSQITLEVQELLTKELVVETQASPKISCLRFSLWKRKTGSETSDKPEGSQINF